MDATPRGGAMGRAGFRRRHALWVAAVVLLAGGLFQACTDNSGPAGPGLGAGETGSADTTAQVRVQITINPGVIRRGSFTHVTVVVTNIPGGQALPGKRVNLSTNGGVLSDAVGVTDANGEFRTLLNAPCETTFTSATVIAFVQGSGGATSASQILTISGSEPQCGATSP